MKANENLMVGDWVKFKGSDLYHQVKVVSNKSIKFDNQKWFAKSSVEPISLTPEILEKNGFIEVKHYYPYPTYEYVVDSQKFLIRVAFPKDSKATERTKPIVEVDAEWCWHSGDCEFFHELQHVLRDCKIKKEIVL